MYNGIMWLDWWADARATAQKINANETHIRQYISELVKVYLAPDFDSDEDAALCCAVCEVCDLIEYLR